MDNNIIDGKLIGNEDNIVFYTDDEDNVNIEVLLQNENVWLNIESLTKLFKIDRTGITRHINNIYKDEELEEDATCAKIAQVQKEGTRRVTRNISYYNLDMIISIGFRVNSKPAIKFRKWSNKVIKEYMVKGFALDDERLKGNGGGEYWKELLDRIRDIRSSEKVLYRQVLDLYATSVDYDPKSSESIAFFKMVQNKLHYAVHGHTAAEIIYERADADKPFMGLKSFKGDFPVKSEIGIAKNYLDENELKILNNLVSGYFDFAEIQAMRHNPMHMSDYVQQLDNVLGSTGEQVLQGAGKISHKQAMEKAEAEYRKYQVQTLSPVEEAYLDTIKTLEKETKKKKK